MSSKKSSRETIFSLSMLEPVFHNDCTLETEIVANMKTTLRSQCELMSLLFTFISPFFNAFLPLPNK